MASATEWFHDFCLSCDRQTTDGAYCSQACRLVDLEKAGTSEPASPLSYSSSVSASSYSSTGSTGASGFYLSPAFNFSAYKSSPSSPSSPRSSTSTTTQPTYFQPSTSPMQYAAPSYDRQAKRSLATSSSRASLSSISSASSTQGISDQALFQLRSYVSSFDQTRDMRRRMTYG